MELHCCRYTQWRRKTLAKQRHTSPGRMLLGLLLPVLAGFVIAKTGFGSKSTKQAVNDVSHKFRLHKITVKVRDNDADDDQHQEPQTADSHSHAEGHQLVEPPADRKFLGIF